MKSLFTTFLLLFFCFLVGCQKQEDGLVFISTNNDGVDESILVGFGNSVGFNAQEPYEFNSDIRHELHLWHQGKGRLILEDGSMTSMEGLKNFVIQHNYEIAHTRLYFYKQDEDWMLAYFDSALKPIARMGFAEIRLRYEGDFTDQPKGFISGSKNKAVNAEIFEVLKAETSTVSLEGVDYRLFLVSKVNQDGIQKDAALIVPVYVLQQFHKGPLWTRRDDPPFDNLSPEEQRFFNYTKADIFMLNTGSVQLTISL